MTNEAETALMPTRNGKKSSDSGEEKAELSADVSLPAEVLEKLYQSYAIKQKRDGLSSFLVASLMFDLWAIIVPQGQRVESLVITCAFMIANVGLLVFLMLCGRSRFKGAIWEVAPHLAWLFAILQLFLQLFFKGTVTPRDSLGWAVLINFLVFVTLPVPLKYTGILLGIGSFVIYDHTIFGLTKKENFFWAQQGANMVLMLSATGVGLLCYFLGEAKQRRAFLEAKKSLEVKMLIEEQSAEQERLLLSVLPEHVAVKMRQDLGSTDKEQFKKIYMSRHENVSILYADIVGFTAISSKYSAPDLVKMLNELFARFDRLAEKYHQLRIKILGDCYYCIAGAPVETEDHAALCVYMGLSMVKAIKYVQKKTNSPVDMRVGIHTGAVLAGILGQRQWQFDVYSRDVELANKMESSGMAGRVHISEKTHGFLNGEFEVEPGFGEKREESLRIAGLKTYFITKVLKPFESSEPKNDNGTPKVPLAANGKPESIEQDGPSEIFKDDDDSKCTSPTGHTTDEEGAPGPDTVAVAILDEEADKQKDIDYRQRLRTELVGRDGHGELSKETSVWLTFKNEEHEAAYAAFREPFSSVPLIAALVIQIVGSIYSVFVLPQTMLHFVMVLSPLVIIVPLVFVSVAESFEDNLPPSVVQFSRKFNNLKWLRRSAAVVVMLLIGIHNSADMFLSSMTELPRLNVSGDAIDEVVETSGEYIPTPTDTCLFPSYFSCFAVLILITTTVITQLSHVAKILVMVVVTGLHCAMNIFFLEEQFKNEDYHTWNTHAPLRFTMSALLVAVTIALSHLARHIDRRDRLIFMWKIQAREQKEKASDMRRRNEALVYNILPMHVAEHFMSNKKRSYDELYSQSYAEVGVLFASMPNFSDFYSEETVNNQGLECLRFLNEVISDFDALLELPQFKDVIKIKTIGSTYMAASGLNPTRVFQPEDEVVVRWLHLARLVEFALELKRVLQDINEQSFNHFVLKMGINHGPITAGVIGARKPHYDIWGNTVNVASRMESTGKAGAIQVTEETCQILQQFDYTFEQRGLVAVKGKGQLLTFYLQGKGNKKVSESVSGSPAPVARSSVVDGDQSSGTDASSAKATDNLLGSKSSPRAGQRSLSSCSNSPSSVRVNKEYVEQLKTTTSTATAEMRKEEEDDGKATNSEDDIDSLDAKTPLLKEKKGVTIVGVDASNSNNNNTSSSNIKPE